MKHHHSNIEKQTLDNTNFRQVLFTGRHCQLVVMNLQVGEDIGMEVHADVDQFFRIEQGQAKFIIDDQEFQAIDNEAVIISAGSRHNVINTGSGQLKLYTIYSPPNHPAGTIHATKAEADKSEESHH